MDGGSFGVEMLAGAECKVIYLQTLIYTHGVTDARENTYNITPWAYSEFLRLQHEKQ